MQCSPGVIGSILWKTLNETLSVFNFFTDDIENNSKFLKIKVDDHILAIGMIQFKQS